MTPGDRDLRRAHVIAAMEAATGEGIAIEDATADELLAAAERAGVGSTWLIAYFCDEMEGYSAARFERWLAKEREQDAEDEKVRKPN